MKVFGKDVKFRRTVGATCKIAEACPDGDIQRIGEMVDANNLAKSQKFIAIFICAMNEGYEKTKAISDPTYTPNPVTFDEIMCLDQDELTTLIDEAMATFNTVNTTVEAVPKKNRGKKTP